MRLPKRLQQAGIGRSAPRVSCLRPVRVAAAAKKHVGYGDDESDFEFAVTRQGGSRTYEQSSSSAPITERQEKQQQAAAERLAGTAPLQGTPAQRSRAKPRHNSFEKERSYEGDGPRSPDRESHQSNSRPGQSKPPRSGARHGSDSKRGTPPVLLFNFYFSFVHDISGDKRCYVLSPAGGRGGGSRSQRLQPSELTRYITDSYDVNELYQAVQAHSRSFNVVHACAAFVRYAKLRRGGSAASSDALLQQLTSLVQMHLPECSVRQLSNILHAMATLR